jgi:phosphatidylglycerol:prolipoprotein diacylglycerol transferase
MRLAGYAPSVIDWTPSSIALQIGPLGIPWYGLGYAVAIGFGVWLAGVQARQRGLDTAFIGDALIWVVAFGIIGARLYHVVDQWQLYRDDLLKIVLPPYSGLALYGGVGGGLVGLLVVARRRGQSYLAWVDVAIPSLFLGQAIARWGNFFNQELYGPPTNLPWGIAIDCAHRVAPYACPPGSDPQASLGQHFHPLFFYESSLTLVGGLLALWAARRFAARLRDGDLLSFWFIWYGALRALLEPLRSPDSQGVIGISVVIVICGVVIAVGAGSIVLRHRGPRGKTPAAPAATVPPAD